MINLKVTYVVVCKWSYNLPTTYKCGTIMSHTLVVHVENFCACTKFLDDLALQRRIRVFQRPITYSTYASIFAKISYIGLRWRKRQGVTGLKEWCWMICYCILNFWIWMCSNFPPNLPHSVSVYCDNMHSCSAHVQGPFFRLVIFCMAPNLTTMTKNHYFC